VFGSEAESCLNQMLNRVCIRGSILTAACSDRLRGCNRLCGSDRLCRSRVCGAIAEACSLDGERASRIVVGRDDPGDHEL